MIGEALEALSLYHTTLEGKDARYIHYCNLQCYVHWRASEYAIAIKWGLEGEELRSTGVDTEYSTSHYLALSQRDSGAIDPALKAFLGDNSLAEVINPKKIIKDLSEAFYGNVGRCLHLMGQIDSAIICYRKSAILIEQRKGDKDIEDQAFIRQWIGELFATKQEHGLAVVFLEAAIAKWLIVSPPKGRDLAERMHSQFGFDRKSLDASSAENEVLSWIRNNEI